MGEFSVEYVCGLYLSAPSSGPIGGSGKRSLRQIVGTIQARSPRWNYLFCYFRRGTGFLPNFRRSFSRCNSSSAWQSLLSWLRFWFKHLLLWPWANSSRCWLPESSHIATRPPVQCRQDSSFILPPLRDSVVINILWPKLNDPPSISLLYRIWRVNKTWMRLIARTLEWNALEFIKLDNRPRLFTKHQWIN